jgi:8-oxo-dGTP pyrophosphatase MutT (NUDIX family)
MKEPIHGIDFIGFSIAFYCNDGKGTFVMHKRSKNTRDEQGMWDFGGGKVEFGSEIEESVLREVQEEYGLEGKIQEQLPAHSTIRVQNGKQTHWIVIPFFVEVDLSKVKNNEPHKIDEIGFFKLSELPNPIHSAVKHTMEKYSEYFDKYRL